MEPLVALQEEGSEGVKFTMRFEVAQSTGTGSSLLEQLSAAGVPKNAGTDPVTESDKQKLLGHLKASHGTAGGERKKITLVKKSTSEIKQADATGRA